MPTNIFVRRSDEGSDWEIISILDWLHTSILPQFLLADIPQDLLYYGPLPQYIPVPAVPNGLDDESEELGQFTEEEFCRSLFLPRRYIVNTEKYNTPLYVALNDDAQELRSRLYNYASYPWEGETLELKLVLIEATEMWEELWGVVKGALCPVVFDADDVRETMELDEHQRKSDHSFEMLQGIIGHVPEGWVSTENYEEAMARCKMVKKQGVPQDMPDEERAEVLEHWPWDDMDEEEYN